MNYLITFILIFVIFGSKVSIVEIPILTAFICFLCLFYIKRLFYPKEFIQLIFFSFLILCYSIIIVGINNSSDWYAIMRQARATAAIIFLGLIVYNVPIKSVSMLKALNTVLLINSISIFIQIIYPESQYYFSQFTLYDKGFSSGKAFGLTVGHNQAGYLCLFGIVISSFLAYSSDKKKFFLISISIFTISSIFTGRTTLILVAFVTFVISMIYFFKGKGLLRIFAIFYFIFIICGIAIYLIPLLIYSIPLLSDMGISATSIIDYDFQYIYSKRSYDLLTDEMWILPDTINEIIFGSGLNVDSDIGYIKLIYMIGIIGLAMVMITYFYLFYKMFNINNYLVKYLRHSQQNVCKDYLFLRSSTLVLLIFITMMFVANIKDLMLFTRQGFEICIILFFSNISNFRMLKKAGKQNGFNTAGGIQGVPVS